MQTNLTTSHLLSKKTSLLLSAATAMVCSRALFFFFQDPEGPNLLIVGVFALGIYALSLAAYLFGPSVIKGVGRLLAVIGLQVLAVAGLYFCMR